MKHIKKFEGFRSKPEAEEQINETVFQVENTYRVNIIADVEAKLLSAYAKKVKQNMNKEITDLMGNAMLAEELVRWVLINGLDVDKIPASAIIGGAQGQAQAQGQGQVQIQDQSQPQAQGQGQSQGQGQAQGQGQGQAQVQVQTQGQGQGMEEVQSQGGSEELPV
jgi:cobalamin biosynthesis Mg chelatase CobN